MSDNEIIKPASGIVPSPIDPAMLASLGVKTSDQIQDSAHARILVLGPPKVGKTRCIGLTAPGPVLFLNADGNDSTKPVRAAGGTPLEIAVTNRSSWKKGVEAAEKLAANGTVKTVVLDTLTLLADSLIDEISVTKSGNELWAEYGEQLMRGIRRLTRIKAHLFVVAHMPPAQKIRMGDAEDGSTSEGVLPILAGQAKFKIPALLTDWVVFDALPLAAGATEVNRVFFVGPQKRWSTAGRNARRSGQIAADCRLLLAEFGFKGE